MARPGCSLDFLRGSLYRHETFQLNNDIEKFCAALLLMQSRRISAIHDCGLKLPRGRAFRRHLIRELLGFLNIAGIERGA